MRQNQQFRDSIKTLVMLKKEIKGKTRCASMIRFSLVK